MITASMAYGVVTLIQALSYGLLLFLLTAGLTVVLGYMGVLNFAHAAFYMLGAYVGVTLAKGWGWGIAWLLTPCLIGFLAWWIERLFLARLHQKGHVPELLMTYGIALVLSEIIPLFWGRMPQDPEWANALQTRAFTVIETTQTWWITWGETLPMVCREIGVMCWSIPQSRLWVMGVAVGVMVLMAGWLMGTRWGWVVLAVQTHPLQMQAMGYPVPYIWAGVFAVGAGLAGLAGILAGASLGVDSQMAAQMGPVVFVIVVLGGVGSVLGALWAAGAVALLQTVLIAYPWQGTLSLWEASWSFHTSTWSPMVPYGLLILGLMWRRNFDLTP